MLKCCQDVQSLILYWWQMLLVLAQQHQHRQGVNVNFLCILSLFYISLFLITTNMFTCIFKMNSSVYCGLLCCTDPKPIKVNTFNRVMPRTSESYAKLWQSISIPQSSESQGLKQSTVIKTTNFTSGATRTGSYEAFMILWEMKNN